MKNSECSDKRKNLFKRLTNEERKKLIRKKLKEQRLTEGSGASEKEKSTYDKEEIIELILLTKCFKR